MGHEHNVQDLDARFTIDPVTRQIKNESKKKLLLAQGDHNSEIYGFRCPRYIESHDMSLCNKVEVHFFNYESQSKKVNSGKYEVTDLKIGEDESTVEFSWTISGNGTQLQGYTEFLVRFKCVDENDIVTYAWNTLFFSDVNVGRGSTVDELFETEYVDIIEQWKASVMRTFKDDLTAWKNAKEQELAEDLTAWEQEAKEEIEADFNAYISEWNQKLAVERARIDQFKALKEGSTTGDAELMDIRVGADGKTYGSAGAAVREQFTNITGKNLFLKGSRMFIGAEQGNCPYTDVNDFPCNSIIVNGYNISSWMSNMPCDDFIGTFITFSYSGVTSDGGVVQLAFKNNGSALYSRIRWAKWSEWKETPLGEANVPNTKAIIPSGVHITASNMKYDSFNDFPPNTVVAI